MKKNYQRGLAVIDRVVRDPMLVQDIWGRIRARYTDKQHQKRLDDYARLATHPVSALSALFGVEEAVVNSYMESAPLRGLLAELEAYQIPQEAHDMGGSAFLEVVYAIARHLKPQTIVETGVAHGYSSAALLQAIEDNQEGRLYSADLPTFRPGIAPYTGGAVPQRLRSMNRWELILGPDRRTIPPLLKRIGPIDLFLYDSDKSYEGMLHTWDLVWPHLSPGAMLVLDDIHPHDAYLDFIDARGVEPIIVSKPTHQGVYNWEKNFYVGFIRKPVN